MLDIFIAAHISRVEILKIVYMAVRVGMCRRHDAMQDESLHVQITWRAMITTLITPTDPDWNDLLARCRHDVYHKPGWTITSQIGEGGTGFGVHAHDGDADLFVPLLRRELGNGDWDASSPYGYAGPVCSDGASQAFLDAAFQSMVDTLRSKGCISWFMRLHPLLNADWQIASGLTVDHGPTISIDLTLSEETLWQNLRPAHRRAIRKACEQGMTVSVDTHREHMDAFIDVYHSDMRRLGASSYYLFGRDYFDSLFSTLPGHALLMIAKHQGELAGGVIFTLAPSSGIMQYHLSTTHANHRALQPAKLIVHTAALWGKHAGYRQLHLGGGIGAAEDSLFLFKRGFSHDMRRFRSQRVLVDHQKYRRLSGLCNGAKLELDGFFPAYRKLPRPESIDR